MVTLALLTTVVVVQHRCLHGVADSATVLPVILDVRIGTVASATVRARRVGDTALLPLAQILALADIAPTRDCDTYVSTDSLSIILHAPIAIDWEDLTASIVDDGTLPVSERVAREQRRIEFNGRRTPASPGAADAVTPSMPHDLIVDYQLATAGRFTRPAFQIGMGSNLLHGGLNLDWATGAKGGLERPVFSWERTWPVGALVRELVIGNIQTPHGSMIQTGLFASTDARVHTDVVDRIDLRGQLGPGWEVEAYRDDVLVYAGLASAQGRYALDIPVSRGANRVRIAAHGPNHERLALDRYVSIGEDMMPSGTAAYDFLLGRCGVPQCEFAAELVARYAPLERITAGAALTARSMLLGKSMEPSGFLAARVRDDINAAARYSPRDASAEFHYAPTPMFDLIAGYRHTSTTPVSTTSFSRRSSAAGNIVWRPRTDRSLTATLELSGSRLTDEQRARVGSAMSFSSAYIRPFATLTRRLTPQRSPFGFGTLADVAIPLLPAGSRLRWGISNTDSDEPFIAIAVPIRLGGRVELSAERTSTTARRFTITISAITRPVKYDARLVSDARRATSMQSLSGSLLLSDGGSPAMSRLVMSPTPSRGRAEIAGTVFIDQNLNGVFDASEQSLPDVTIIAGSQTIEADSAGIYHVLDLIPFVSVVLSVDSLTLPSSDLTAGARRILPLPNAVTRVNFPVRRRSSSSAMSGVARFSRLTQDAKCGDASTVHRDHFETGPGDPDAIPNARQASEPREHVAAKC